MVKGTPKFWYFHGIVGPIRVTPTGKISACGYFFKEDGTQVTTERYAMPGKGRPATPAEIFRYQQLLTEALDKSRELDLAKAVLLRKLQETDWRNLPEDTLRMVGRILYPQKLEAWEDAIRAAGTVKRAGRGGIWVGEKK